MSCARTYRNRSWDFEIDVPSRWKGPSWASQVLRKDSQPAFRNPDGSLALQMAIGPYTGPTGLFERAEMLRKIAARHRHDILDIGSIRVLGQEHPTMTYLLPALTLVGAMTPQFESQALLRNRPLLKNWHLLFRGIEYLFTVHLYDASPLLNPDIVADTPTKADDIVVLSFRFITSLAASREALEETNRRIAGLLREPSVDSDGA